MKWECRRIQLQFKDFIKRVAGRQIQNAMQKYSQKQAQGQEISKQTKLGKNKKRETQVRDQDQ